jgi:hypothetical protein
LSQTQRQAANEWCDHTLYSRLNDKLSGAIVLIMHRLHEDDLAGHVLTQEKWEVVRLPAIADDDEAHRVETVFGPQSFGRKAGEVLYAEREPREMLGQIRRTFGEYNFAGRHCRRDHRRHTCACASLFHRRRCNTRPPTHPRGGGVESTLSASARGKASQSTTLGLPRSAWKNRNEGRRAKSRAGNVRQRLTAGAVVFSIRHVGGEISRYSEAERTLGLG